MLERIVEAIKELAGQNPNVGSVGIGVPGEVYMETGHVRDLPNLPDAGSMFRSRQPSRRQPATRPF